MCVGGGGQGEGGISLNQGGLDQHFQKVKDILSDALALQHIASLMIRPPVNNVALSMKAEGYRE